MRPHSINLANNFIGGWFIENDLCDSLIEYHKNSQEKYLGAVNGDSQSFHNIIRTDIKDSTDVRLNDILLGARYTKEIQTCVDNYIEQYPYCNIGAPWVILSAPTIQHYAPGQAYHAWHTERQFAEEPIVSRHLVFMTYLNDVNDGGETEFFHQELKIKPEKGLTLIWPADWTFFHRGLTSNSEEKYVITGWFNYIKK